MLNKKIETAFANTEPTPATESQGDNEDVNINDEVESNIVTTEEELEAYYIVRAILSKYIDVERISYSDKESYFAIILDDRITKWLCRIYIKKNKKYISIVENGEKTKYSIENISDIYGYADKLFARLQVLDVK
jgi:predicted type IV restriction endonuclease